MISILIVVDVLQIPDLNSIYLSFYQALFDAVECDAPRVWEVYFDTQDSVSPTMSDLLEYFTCIIIYNILVIILQFMIGLLYLSVSSRLFNKLLTPFKKKWPNIIIIFTIGIISRILVNNYLDINVFTDYFSWISLGYYSCFSTFSVFIHSIDINTNALKNIRLNNITLENLLNGMKYYINGYFLNRSTMDAEDYSNIKYKDVYNLNMYSSNQQGNQTGSQYNGGNNVSSTGGGNSQPDDFYPLGGAPPAMINSVYQTPELQYIPGSNQPAGRMLALAMQKDALYLNMNIGIQGSHLILENRYKSDAIQFMHDYIRDLRGLGTLNSTTISNTPEFRRALYNLR